MTLNDVTAPNVNGKTTETGVDDHDEIEDDVDVDELAGGAVDSAAKKKKKKKAKKKKAKVVQSDPPRIGLSKFFPDGIYSEGETQEYNENNSFRTTSAEMRERERFAMGDPEETCESIRRAAEVHRQVRAHARRTIRPDMRMLEIADLIENGVRALVEESGLDSGLGFPTGLSLNSCAAHYTPNAGDATVLSASDVLKVDIGVHVRGRICDSAFTLNFEPTYDRLLEAVKAATNTGIKESGIDARLGEIGAAIQETMESYEVDVGGKTLPGLGGHTITPYMIHGGTRGKSVLMVKNDDATKMEEGEYLYFAIETFGSAGLGRVIEQGECSHYAKIYNAPPGQLRLQTDKALLRTIDKSFGTLTFCRRYLDRIGESRYALALKHLVEQGVVQDFLPLCDQRGSITAQFEHTILLHPTREGVVSRGEDY